jgi:hypothetical protein
MNCGGPSLVELKSAKAIIDDDQRSKVAFASLLHDVYPF